MNKEHHLVNASMNDSRRKMANYIEYWFVRGTSRDQMYEDFRQLSNEISNMNLLPYSVQYFDMGVMSNTK